MRLRILAVAAVLFIATASAKADSIIYNVQGTLDTGTFSGSVTYNNVTNALTGGSITTLISGTSEVFSNNVGSGTFGTGLFQFLSSSSKQLALGFLQSDLSSGSLAGSLCSRAMSCGGAISGISTTGKAVTVGTYFTSNAATPEPSSLLLLGTGALGIVGAVRRRMA